MPAARAPSSLPEQPRLLALCPRPTEPLCAAELSALPEVVGVQARAGAVAFSGAGRGGDFLAMYRANLRLRTATRVLWLLDDVRCRDAGDLYEAARALPWEQHLRPGGTLAVSAHGQVPGLHNTMFTAVRVKDAVVDRFRDRTGGRPDVDPRDPDLRINVQLYEGEGGPRASIALDSSGEALHRRGYRTSDGGGGGEAPLKETLAAALLLQAGYDGGVLVDPLCGSGTLVIEGGLVALRRAPGLGRRFGFERWRSFDAALWRQARAEAEAAVVPPHDVLLHGSDRDRRMIEAATRNAQAAGVSAVARFAQGELAGARPPPGPPGIVICNPPYGERMGQGEDLVALYRALGDVLKRHFTGYTAWVFTANQPLAKQIGLRPAERHVFFNGNLEGRLLKFTLY